MIVRLRRGSETNDQPNHQPNFKAMKTPNLNLTTVLCLPAAWLLCQCAPTGGVAPPAVVSMLVSARIPEPHPPLAEWFGLQNATDTEEPSGISELKPPPTTRTGGLPAVMLPPMIVYAPPTPAAPVADWPANVIAAEDLSHRIVPKQDSPADFPLGQSGEQWLESPRYTARRCHSCAANNHRHAPLP